MDRHRAVAAIVAVAVAIVTFALGDDDGGSAITDSRIGGDNSANSCANLGEGDQTCYVEQVEDLASKSEAEILAAAEQAADVPPVGDGPWPFSVVKTGPIGLKVRSTNVEEAVQLGGIAHLNSVWAWCQAASGFDPVPDDEDADVWLQIAWDHQDPNTTDYFQSEPGADGRGWTYAGFTAPVGHNGDIPNC